MYERYEKNLQKNSLQVNTIMENKAILDTSGIIFMILYLLSLLLVGVIGRLARKEDSLSDFYLGGRKMGLFVLFLTLYATQYSGNTLIGYAGNSYRQGYVFLVSVTFMMSIIGAYLIFAPKLHLLSKKYGFITVGDYIQHRFNSRLLTGIVVVISIIALGNYIISNLKAMGYIVEVSTGGRISFAQGVLFLSIIMVVYETLGGMRSVAWTDVIQGILLIAGCLFLFLGIQYQYGGLALVGEQLMAHRHDLWMPPDVSQKWFWFSTIVIVFFGISVYPQAIQRIYAARNARTLRRSFQIMVFMPLATTFFMVIVGIVGITRFPGLDRNGSEQITMLLLTDMAAHVPGIKLLFILFLSAAVAAIMSTVDSALLAISSLFTQDIYRLIRPDSCQARLTSVGKYFSWGFMACMAFFAVYLPQTIWRLAEIKLEILCQVAPAIFLGVHWKHLQTSAVVSGIIAGVSVTLFLMIATIVGLPIIPKHWGIHAGVYGLAVNFLTIGIVSVFNNSPEVVLEGKNSH